MFELHSRLAEDTLVLGDFPLSRLLLMNDSSYPWLILVPRRNGIREIFELPSQDQQQLLRESSHLSQTMSRVFHADKLNIAALGNVVPQLHLHHIARYETDPAWPKPIWGLSPARPYSERASQEICAALIEHLVDFKTGEKWLLAPRVC